MDAITRETLLSYGNGMSLPSNGSTVVGRGRYAVSVRTENGEYVVAFYKDGHEHTPGVTYDSASDMLQDVRGWLGVE